jgi:hypothetical protein
MSRPWNAAEYLAIYADLQAAYGPDPFAASWHWQTFGQAEGRACGFDGLCYVAGYDNLRAAFGADPTAGALHYVRFGRAEGRAEEAFGAGQYLANYGDLRAAYGNNTSAAAWHFITFGAREGRNDDVPPGRLIEGTAGADTMRGGPGDDAIFGGGGQDVMTGGRGEDVFRFGSPTAPTVIPWAVVGDAWGDRITDFQPGVDTIDLSALGTRRLADGVIADAKTFRFIGNDPFHADVATPEVRYEHRADGTTAVLADGWINAVIKEGSDGRADLWIILDGHHALTAGDFIL